MATTINCNEIHQVALELQMKFQNCSVLDANDLDCLVDLITAVGDCITAGSYNQNNIVERIEVTRANDIEPISTIVNNLPLFTVNEDRIFVFSVSEGSGGTSLYLFKPGKGVYGTGSTVTLTEDDFILLNSQVITNTSELINDGENGTDPFITEAEVINMIPTISDIPDGLDDDGNTSIELMEGSNILDTLDTCPLTINCIENNPNTILDIINNNPNTIINIISNEDLDPLIPVAIEIDLGNCGNLPTFSNPTIVYIERRTSVVNSSQKIILTENDVLYTDNTLSTPFNGLGNIYMYRGISPNFLFEYQYFPVTTLGNIDVPKRCSENIGKIGSMTFTGIFPSGSSFEPFLSSSNTDYSILENVDIISILIELYNDSSNITSYYSGTGAHTGSTNTAGINKDPSGYYVYRTGNTTNGTYRIVINYKLS